MSWVISQGTQYRNGMAYNRLNYLKRVRDIQQLATQYYEPGRQDRNWRWVWRNHVNPRFHISYARFITILGINVGRQTEEEQRKLHRLEQTMRLFE